MWFCMIGNILCVSGLLLEKDNIQSVQLDKHIHLCQQQSEKYGSKVLGDISDKKEETMLFNMCVWGGLEEKREEMRKR